MIFLANLVGEQKLKTVFDKDYNLKKTPRAHISSATGKVNY